MSSNTGAFGRGSKNWSGKNGGKKGGNMTWRRDQPKWKPENEELGTDFLFVVGSTNAADRFNKTKDRIVSYVKTNYTYGTDISTSLSKLKHIDLTKEVPKAPSEEGKTRQELRTEVELHKEMMKRYGYRWEYYKKNLGNAYGLIMGQCTPSLKSRLKSQVPDWEDFDNASDPVELLKKIREQTHDMQSHKFPLLCLRNQMANVYGGIEQREHEGNAAFKERYEAEVQTLESLGGKQMFMDFIKRQEGYKEAAQKDEQEWRDKLSEVIEIKMADPSPDEDPDNPEDDYYYASFDDVKIEDLEPTRKFRDKFEQDWYNRLIGVNFLCSLNKGRSEEMIKDMENAWGDNRDTFPQDLEGALKKSVTYRKIGAGGGPGNGKGKGKRGGGPSSDGTGTELNLAQPDPKKLKSDHSNKTCYLCGMKGHIKPLCPLNPKSPNFDPKLVSKVQAANVTQDEE